MDQKKLDRINELARKSKAEGLTEEEKSEQAVLRQEYVALVRKNLRGQLDNISIQDEDGSVVHLGEKFGKGETKKLFKKEHIRKYISQARKAISEEELHQRSLAVNKAFVNSDYFRKASVMFAYIGVKGEVLTEYLIQEAIKAGKKVAVPKVEGDIMRFYYIRQFSDLEPGYFGIPEPILGLKEARKEGVLIVMPGVAFDLERHRVGYGKGFYDKYLAQRKKDIKVALAFDFQIFNSIEYNQYDILPERIYTESRII